MGDLFTDVLLCEFYFFVVGTRSCIVFLVILTEAAVISPRFLLFVYDHWGETLQLA